MTAAAPAGFWRRYVAYSLDFAVLGALATGLAWSRILAGWRATGTAVAQLTDLVARQVADLLLAGGSPQALMHEPRLLAAADAVQSGVLQMVLPWLLTYALLAVVWHVGGERSPWQGSPGKRALHLQVTDADGARPGLARLLLRHGAAALSWLTFNLGHALAAVPPQKRALHDYLAGARVLCTAPSPRLPPWAWAWLALQAAALVAAIAWLLARYTLALQAGLGLG